MPLVIKANLVPYNTFADYAVPAMSLSYFPLSPNPFWCNAPVFCTFYDHPLLRFQTSLTQNHPVYAT